MDQALANIERDNPRLNIVMDHAPLPATQCTDGALKNFSVAVKSNIAVKGLPFTAGMAAFRQRIADEDAVVVAELRKAGAIILGTVNMEEAALGALTHNPHFGRTENPRRPGFTPGGSSGGSAAAVAAGFARVALGTDTMGSCRIPAAYCGVVGYKPGYGRISMGGVEALCLRLDHVGLLASSVADIRDVATCLFVHSRSEVKLGALRFAVLDENAKSGLQIEVANAYANALSVLQGAGATLIPRAIDQTVLAAARRAGLLLCEAELARTLREPLERNDGGISAHLRSMIAFAGGKNNDDFVRAHQKIDATAALEKWLLDDVDALLWPTAPQTAFSFTDPVPASQADFTCLANFTGSPALSLPLPVREGGLPVGLQIMTARDEDAMLLAISAAIETAL